MPKRQKRFNVEPPVAIKINFVSRVYRRVSGDRKSEVLVEKHGVLALPTFEFAPPLAAIFERTELSNF